MAACSLACFVVCFSELMVFSRRRTVIIPKPVEKSATMLCGSLFSRRVNRRAFGKSQLVVIKAVKHGVGRVIFLIDERE